MKLPTVQPSHYRSPTDRRVHHTRRRNLLNFSQRPLGSTQGGAKNFDAY